MVIGPFEVVAFGSEQPLELVVVAMEEPSLVVELEVAEFVVVEVLQLVEPIEQVVGRPLAMVLELARAEEELGPIVELAFVSSQLVVEPKVQQLELEVEFEPRQVAIQELVKHLRLEVVRHPKQEEYFHQLLSSTLDDLSCNDQDI